MKLFNIVKSLVRLYCYPSAKVVLFNSFEGQYNDNPKYISQLLHKIDPSVPIYWTMSHKSRESFPDYVRCVEMESDQYYKLVYTASVVVDNHTGLRSATCRKNYYLKRLLLWIRNKKRINQLNISTWHGTPLKKIGMDEPDAKSNMVFYCSTNYILSGSLYSTKAFESAFLSKSVIKEYGTPRNDILVNNNLKKDDIKLRLGIPLGKKVILYAPTFRNNPDISGLVQMNSFNYNQLLSSLSDKFGGEWVFVFRVHNLVLNLLESIDFAEYDAKIVNGNLHDDMAEYLYCSDVLLTDYSGSMFDFLLTKRPCFLYTPDIYEYATYERGFYMTLDSLPFPSAKTFNDLIDVISSFDEKKYSSDLEKFINFIGNKEDGRASERVVNDILSFLQ